MTVEELLTHLERFPKDAGVKVAVRVFTRAHAIANETPFEIDGSYDGCTLWISLPQSMHVVDRKKR